LKISKVNFRSIAAEGRQILAHFRTKSGHFHKLWAYVTVLKPV